MRRIPQLDGVRGIAILMVLVWHYYACQVPFRPHTVVWYFSRASSLTWSGVDLFFVLSGFLIAGILLDHREASNYFGIFYLRRACRILPLYGLLLTLFVFFAATPIGRSPSYDWLFARPVPLLAYATFTQNMFMTAQGDYGANFLGITWSLAVEEQFYLLVPLLVLLLPRRALLWTLSAGILAAPLLRYAFPGFQAYISTPWRADSLLSGAVLAVLVRSVAFVSFVRRHRSALLVVFGVLLAGIAAMILRPKREAIDSFWLAGTYSVFILIAFLDAEPRLVRLLRSRMLVWFGELSYGIYMFHPVVAGLAHGWVRHRPPEMLTLADAPVTLAALFITLLLAWTSFRFFESPILRFGHRFRYAPGAAEAG